MVRSVGRCAFAVFLFTVFARSAIAQESAAETLTPHDIARLRSVDEVVISPDGRYVAYTLSVPRRPGVDDDGPAWSELHVVDVQGDSRPFVAGEINVSRIRWTPDGRGISFLAKRGTDKRVGLYAIPVDGGEARRLIQHDSDIADYAWSPDGRHVAFLAREKVPAERKRRRDRGFNAKVFEEDWRAVRVWIARIEAPDEPPRMLELPGSASGIEWSPAGDLLAVGLAPTPLVDDQMMRRRIHVVRAESGEITARVDTPGKLGPFRFSTDGRWLALLAGADLHDPSDGRLLVVPASGGEPRDVLPDLPGQVEALAWQDANTVMFVASDGVWTTFGKVRADGSDPRQIVPVGGPILRSLSLSADGQSAAFRADSPAHPAEVFHMKHGDAAPRRLTDSNPWLARKRLAAQERVEYVARDGLRLEGILVRPLDEQPGQRYPLILSVHGGPEAHISNGWVTGYSSPGQVAAARGFAVFYPNYRGSTGRGVAFSKAGQGDPAGREFDDLVDALGYLDSIGLIDRTRVGITGGSYGGYASAWAATKLTEHFAAAVMFVGLSDLVSKSGTTDIPTEEYLVHARRWPWEDWERARERSPLTYTPQARTPILICHGEEDTRVHPSQSLELYRYLKLIGQAPVRLVLYPGEGHGNRKAASRLDYSLRQLRWLEHYLKGPGGDPPPYELDYGIEMMTKEQGADEQEEEDE